MTARAEGQGRAEKLATAILVMMASTYTYEQLTNALTHALAEARREVLDEGNLWSLFRRILEQGGAIQQDYKAGHFESYEHYSARLDEAARERVEAFIAQAIRQPHGAGEE